MSLPPVGICCGGRWIGTTTVPVLTTGGSGRRIRSTTSLARVNSMLRSLSLAQAGPKAGLDIATAKAAREISTLVVVIFSCLLTYRTSRMSALMSGMTADPRIFPIMGCKNFLEAHGRLQRSHPMAELQTLSFEHS